MPCDLTELISSPTLRWAPESEEVLDLPEILANCVPMPVVEEPNLADGRRISTCHFSWSGDTCQSPHLAQLETRSQLDAFQMTAPLYYGQFSSDK